MKFQGKEVQTLFLESDLGANLHKRGAAKGPARLFDHWKNSFFSSLQPKAFSGEIPQEDRWTEAHHIPAISRFQEAAADEIAHILNQGKFPLIFSGDHSNASATLAGITRAYPYQRTGVLWIDAHADIHTPFTTPSGNMHGMPLALALAEDNVPCWNRKPHEDVVRYWNQMKNIGGRTPMIQPSELYLFELRDLESEEWAILRRLGIRHLSATERKKQSFEKVVIQLLHWASSFPQLYVSFDIDAMDSILVPGTGTPVSGGLSKEEAILLLKSLLQLPNLICFEVTEINPSIESTVTLNTVGEVLIDSLGQVLV